MKFIEELTVWDSASAKNHIYYVDDAKTRMVAYIKNGTTELFRFKRPIQFSTKGRKFRVLATPGEPDSVYFGTPTPDLTKSQSPTTIEVKGSKGETYFLNKVGDKFACSCPGFQFRRKCRHVEQLLEKETTNA
jgi:hypothetical protein